MRGKFGQHFGKPFTKENANFMRLKGLATRRDNRIKRLVRVSCQAEVPKWEMREVRPGVYEQVVIDAPGLSAGRAKQPKLAWPEPNQPSSAPQPPAAQARPLPPVAGPAGNVIVPGPEAGGVVCYGYELAPGVWEEARPRAPEPYGRIAAAEAVARAQQLVRPRD